MTRKRPIMMTDEPPGEDEIVRLARATEMHERVGRISTWITRGCVSVSEDNNAEVVTLQIEDQFFSEPRICYPSTELVAKLALCLQAGFDDRQRSRSADHASDAMKYAIAADTHYGTVDRHRHLWAEVAEIGYSNVAGITAAVKRAPKKLMKVQP